MVSSSKKAADMKLQNWKSVKNVKPFIAQSSLTKCSLLQFLLRTPEQLHLDLILLITFSLWNLLFFCSSI